MYETIPQSRVDEAVRKNKAVDDRLKNPKRVQRDGVSPSGITYSSGLPNGSEQTLPIDKIVARSLVNSPYYKQEKPSYRAVDTSFFNPLIDAGSTLAKKTFDATGLGQAAKAVPAIYDASKTVGYNAARLIDEQFPKGFDAIEKGVGVVSDAVKEGFDATGIPYVYDKAKAAGAGVKNIYGQLTKPIPR